MARFYVQSFTPDWDIRIGSYAELHIIKQLLANSDTNGHAYTQLHSDPEAGRMDRFTIPQLDESDFTSTNLLS